MAVDNVSVRLFSSCISRGSTPPTPFAVPLSSHSDIMYPTTDGGSILSTAPCSPMREPSRARPVLPALAEEGAAKAPAQRVLRGAAHDRDSFVIEKRDANQPGFSAWSCATPVLDPSRGIAVSESSCPISGSSPEEESPCAPALSSPEAVPVPPPVDTQVQTSPPILEPPVVTRSVESQAGGEVEFPLLGLGREQQRASRSRSPEGFLGIAQYDGAQPPAAVSVGADATGSRVVIDSLAEGFGRTPPAPALQGPSPSHHSSDAFQSAGRLSGPGAVGSPPGTARGTQQRGVGGDTVTPSSSLVSEQRGLTPGVVPGSRPPGYLWAEIERRVAANAAQRRRSTSASQASTEPGRITPKSPAAALASSRVLNLLGIPPTVSPRRELFPEAPGQAIDGRAALPGPNLAPTAPQRELFPDEVSGAAGHSPSPSREQEHPPAASPAPAPAAPEVPPPVASGMPRVSGSAAHSSSPVVSQVAVSGIPFPRPPVAGETRGAVRTPRDASPPRGPEDFAEGGAEMGSPVSRGEGDSGLPQWALSPDAHATVSALEQVVESSEEGGLWGLSVLDQSRETQPGATPNRPETAPPAAHPETATPAAPNPSASPVTPEGGGKEEELAAALATASEEASRRAVAEAEIERLRRELAAVSANNRVPTHQIGKATWDEVAAAVQFSSGVKAGAPLHLDLLSEEELEELDRRCGSLHQLMAEAEVAAEQLVQLPDTSDLDVGNSLRESAKTSARLGRVVQRLASVAVTQQRRIAQLSLLLGMAPE
eukprot:Hpha_TRINITY_DN2394_c0_g1::TRINITY_DN2394_c0_g1_i1::g.398::m.398